MALDTVLAKIHTMSDKTEDFVVKHVVDTTALIAATNPLWMTLERIGYGFSESEALAVREDAIILGYLGVGYLYKAGRHGYHAVRKKMTKIANISEGLKKHDGIYGALFSFGFSGVIYLNNGIDLKTALVGSAIGAVASVPSGIMGGLGMDAGRELTDIPKDHDGENVLPNSLANQSPTSKQLIFGAAASLSAATTYALAKLVPASYDSPLTPLLEKMGFL